VMAIGWCLSKKTNVCRDDELVWNKRTNEQKNRRIYVITKDDYSYMLMEMRNV